MKKHIPRLGFCPIGKFVFSNEDAMRYKEALQARLADWGVPFVDLDAVLEDGLVKDQAHVEPAVAHFRRAGIEALFLPHCNFGTEGAAAMIAAKLNLPVLLWGPRDAAPQPDGSRLRDTLCGLFATSKVLHKLGVDFSYIENCRLDEPPLREGVDRFLRAVHIANLFRSGTRIGHIGQRIDFFWSTIVNESELLERFHIEVVPFDMVQFIRHCRNRVRENRAAYRREVDQLRRTCTVEELDDEQLANILAVRDQMLALVADNGLEGLAVQDFMALIEEMGAYCMFADSMVADHCALGYESDIHGTLSDILLRRAGFNESPGFLTDLTIRHPDNDNAVLLWHAGAALGLKAPEARVRLGRHWILPGAYSGMPHFPLKPGPITVARFDGDHGDYAIAVGQGRSVPGPQTLNNAVWMEVDDWPAWERTLIQGPFMHHAAMIYGRYAGAVIEAGRFLPDIRIASLGEPPVHG